MLNKNSSEVGRFIVFDEFKIDPNLFRDAVDQKLFQSPDRKRNWRVYEVQSSDGPSWVIEIDAKDGSSNCFPLADGDWPTVYQWLVEHKTLLTGTG
jgi:hypothetical protein